jgi:hypothetical protein
MGNSQSEKLKDYQKDNFSHTQAGRHTTGRFFKTRNTIKKEKKDKNILISQIFLQIFPSTPDKLRNTMKPSFRKKRLSLEEGCEDGNKSLDICQVEQYEKERIYNQNKEWQEKMRGSLDYELNIKSADDIRKSYIAKLITGGIWLPIEDNKRHNSIIIFDWDDTLLPTTFLTPGGVFTDDIDIHPNDLERIKGLDKMAHKILSLAVNKSDTYIITNAAPGWVEYSARRFYPEVAKVLKNVTIVSARGEFERIHPGDSRQWKIQAFLRMLNDLDINLITNLICLGDSIIEMEAAHILASKFTHAYIKTIKFRESPKPEELFKQLGLVVDQFDKIFSAVKNLTIKVDKKPRSENE